MGEVGTRVPFSVRVGLEEDSSSGILGGVGGNGKGFVKVRVRENWLFGEFFF